MRRESRKMERTPIDLAAHRRYWRITVTSRGCVMCRHQPFSLEERAGREADIRHIEGHHIIPKQLLRREGFADRLWDTRNGIGLCSLHHARHEKYVQRLTRDLIPNEAFEFADELDLAWAIDREYP